ncbi:MAG: sulfotransferase domain-containing protein [Gammaproteobacteria bacterium]
MTALAFRWHCWRRDVSNFALLKYRDFDGFLVTMQHSGTHWLKFMLSVALAEELGLPPPQYVHNDSSNDFIGHPKHARRYPQAPRIASTHSIPHALYDSRLLRAFLRFPPNVVLVRDLRAALVSNYEKWKTRYDVPFSQYLRGDPSGRRYIMDIWNGLHFMNRWARVRRRFPRAVRLIRYEDLEADTATVLAGVFSHFGLDIGAAAITTAVAAGSKDNMAARLDPQAPVQNIIRRSERPPSEWFDAADRAFFERTVERYLDERCGYDFAW